MKIANSSEQQNAEYSFQNNPNEKGGRALRDRLLVLIRFS
jgi:hypothetical protein